MSLYSYWIGLYVHFKKAILHLKRATVPFYLSISVCEKIMTICLDYGLYFFSVLNYMYVDDLFFHHLGEELTFL